MSYFRFAQRTVIGIEGPDARAFLQGLVSNDVRRVADNGFVYALMLTPKGKLLYDSFIIEKSEKILLDIPKPHIEEIFQKFQLYKLKSEIIIADLSKSHYVLGSSDRLNDMFFRDPRHEGLGYRAIVENLLPYSQLEPEDDNIDYEKQRMSLLIPDVITDMIPGTHFPLELGLDEFNAIDYKKGCYIGQEVVARTHYLGVVRKKIYRVKLISGSAPRPSLDIFYNERKIGETLGMVQSQGLTLLRIEEVENITSEDALLQVDDAVLRLCRHQYS